MELVYAFLADAAEVGSNGRFFVFGGGTESVASPSFPATIPNVAVVVKIRFMPDQCDDQHEVVVRSADPREQPFFPEINAPVRIQRNGRPPDRPIYHTTVMNISGIPVREPGAYRIMVFCDGRLEKTLTLYVDHLPLGGAPANENQGENEDHGGNL